MLSPASAQSVGAFATTVTKSRLDAWWRLYLLCATGHWDHASDEEMIRELRHFSEIVNGSDADPYEHLTGFCTALCDALEKTPISEGAPLDLPCDSSHVQYLASLDSFQLASSAIEDCGTSHPRLKTLAERWANRLLNDKGYPFWNRPLATLLQYWLASLDSTLPSVRLALPHESILHQHGFATPHEQRYDAWVEASRATLEDGGVESSVAHVPAEQTSTASSTAASGARPNAVGYCAHIIRFALSVQDTMEPEQEHCFQAPFFLSVHEDLSVEIKLRWKGDLKEAYRVLALPDRASRQLGTNDHTTGPHRMTEGDLLPFRIILRKQSVQEESPPAQPCVRSIYLSDNMHPGATYTWRSHPSENREQLAYLCLKALYRDNAGRHWTSAPLCVRLRRR